MQREREGDRKSFPPQNELNISELLVRKVHNFRTHTQQKVSRLLLAVDGKAISISIRHLNGSNERK